MAEKLETVLALTEDSQNDKVERDFTQRLTHVVDKVKDSAEKLGKGILASAAALSAWSVGVASSVTQASQFARETGISFEHLQELEYAAKASGSSVDALRGDIASMYKTLADRWPNEATWRLNSLGIQTRESGGKIRDMGLVLEDLAGKMQGLSTVRRVELQSKLGLSQDTVRLLMQGKDGIAKLKAEAQGLGLIIPESAAKQAEKFTRILAKTRAIVEGLATKMGIMFLPTLTHLTEKFNLWLQANQAWINLKMEAVTKGVADGFAVIGHIIDAVAQAIGQFITYFSGLIPGFDLADVTITALIAAFVGLGAVALTIIAHFALIGVALGALAVVIEDIVFFIMGKKSVTGDLFKSFEEHYPNIAKALESIGHFLVDIIAPAFGLVKSAVKLVIGILEGAADIILTILDYFAGMAEYGDFWQAIGDGVRAVIVALDELLQALASMDLGRIFDALVNLAATILGAVVDIGAKIISFFLGLVERVGGILWEGAKRFGSWLAAPFRETWDAIASDTRPWWDSLLGGMAHSSEPFFASMRAGFASMLSPALGSQLEALRGVFSSLARGMGGVGKAMGDALVAGLSRIDPAVGELVRSALDDLVGLGKRIVDMVADAGSGMVAYLKDLFGGLFKWLSGQLDIVSSKAEEWAKKRRAEIAEKRGEKVPAAEGTPAQTTQPGQTVPEQPAAKTQPAGVPTTGAVAQVQRVQAAVVQPAPAPEKVAGAVAQVQRVQAAVVQPAPEPEKAAPVGSRGGASFLSLLTKAFSSPAPATKVEETHTVKETKDVVEKPIPASQRMAVVRDVVTAQTAAQASATPLPGAAASVNNYGGARGGDSTITQNNTFNVVATDPNATKLEISGLMSQPQFLQQLSPGNNAPTMAR